MRKITTSALVTTLAAVLQSCSATPDSNGSATLNCSGAVQPSHDLVIEPLFDADPVQIACGKTRRDLTSPQKIRFRVYEIAKINLPIPQSENSGGGSGGDGSSLQEASTTDEEEIRVPRGGIAFAPAINNNLVLAAKKTAIEFQVDPAKCTDESKPEDCLISPHEFMGVVTPQNEWCSDTAGVMTYEFWITCNGNSSSLEASVLSGAVKPTGSYKFDVTAEPTDAELKNP